MSVVVQPLVDSDVLEPSVQNEVAHALQRVESCKLKVEEKVEGERWKMEQRNGKNSTVNLLPFPTNGMSRTDIAIRLVSEQKPDGRWFAGTNDVTATAVEMLKAL